MLAARIGSLVLLVLFTCATTALAGEARVTERSVPAGSQGEDIVQVIEFEAAPGESNSVSLEVRRDVGEELGLEVELADTTAPIRPGRGCRRRSEHAVVCSLDGLDGVYLKLDDGPDSAEVPGFTSASMWGGTGTDRLIGADGNDFLDGGPGRDVIDAGAGEDHIRDAAGDRGEMLDGGTGRFDIIDYSSRRRGIRIDLARGIGGSAGERDRVLRMEQVVGGRGDDVILGNRFNNVFEEAVGASFPGGPAVGLRPRGSGDDLYVGRGGRDRVQSLGGQDRIDGGGGRDRLFCLPDIRQRCRLSGGDGSDILYGSGGPDSLRGGSGNDGMFGARGIDVFFARDRSRDRISGGRGFDRGRVDERRDRVRSLEAVF